MIDLPSRDSIQFDGCDCQKQVGFKKQIHTCPPGVILQWSDVGTTTLNVTASSVNGQLHYLYPIMTHWQQELQMQPLGKDELAIKGPKGNCWNYQLNVT